MHTLCIFLYFNRPYSWLLDLSQRVWLSIRWLLTPDRSILSLNCSQTYSNILRPSSFQLLISCQYMESYFLEHLKLQYSTCSRRAVTAVTATSSIDLLPIHGIAYPMHCFNARGNPVDTVCYFELRSSQVYLEVALWAASCRTVTVASGREGYRFRPTRSAKCEVSGGNL